MKALLKGSQAHLWLWKMFYVKIVLSSFAIFALAWNLGTNNINISSLDFWERVGLFINIGGLFATNLISALDKEFAKIQNGRQNIGAEPQPENG